MCTYEWEQFKSDTGRLIHKYDIYVCDLGDDMNDISGGRLQKTRPCVIISSNRINNPKSNQYYVAPIRTEHIYSVSRENMNEYLNMRRKIGRIYIPLEFSPDDFRFIDMKQITPISVKNIFAYKSSIINPNTKKMINNALREIYFNDEEDNTYEQMVDEPLFNNVFYSSQNVIESKEIQEENEIPLVEDANIVISKKRTGGRPRVQIPENFEDVYYSWKKNEITTKEAMNKLNVTRDKLYRITKRYEEENGTFEPKKEETKEEKKNEIEEIVKIPNGFENIYKKWKANEYSLQEVCKLCGLSENDFKLFADDYENILYFNNRRGSCRKAKHAIPVGFSIYYSMYHQKKISIKDISEKIGKSEATVYRYMKEYKMLSSTSK